jgi:arylformamidase
MVHWPGDPRVVVERRLAMARGDPANLTALSLGAHAGTHVDAPLHYIDGGEPVDAMPLEVGLGPARVVAVRPRRGSSAIAAEDLAPARLRAGERVLLKTKNSPAAWRSDAFVEDAVHLSLEAARLLASRRVALVGIDYLSVGGYRAGDGAAVHRALLEAGAWIVEGLDLTRAPAGPCELVCAPLRIAGAEGAPARVLLRPTRRAAARG